MTIHNMLDWNVLTGVSPYAVMVKMGHKLRELAPAARMGDHTT